MNDEKKWEADRKPTIAIWKSKSSLPPLASQSPSDTHPQILPSASKQSRNVDGRDLPPTSKVESAKVNAKGKAERQLFSNW